MLSKRLLVTLFWDLLAFITLGSITVVLKNGGIEPFQRGFFCFDMSIRHPYKSSTISSSHAMAISLVVPTLYILMVEVGRYLASEGRGRERLAKFGSDWYHFTKIFFLGATTTVMLTSTGKLVIGRLRPHFISVCQPDISFDNLSCGTVDNPTYITSFNCLGQDEEKIHDSRLSFPSGHSSAALYSMLFTAMYLQKRLPSLSSRSFTIMNQVLLMLYAWYCTLTRISDYKHNPTDVLSGALLGIVMSFATFYQTRRRKRNEREWDEKEEKKTERRGRDRNRRETLLL